MERLSEKPFDYLVGRCTDPYQDVNERNNYCEAILTKMKNEYNGPAISIDLLSHKLSSPSNDEVLATIRVLDYLVRHGGEKVHERCGRYRFLNELVRLICPKYMGKFTSEDVKSETTKLLYIMQLSIKHIPKFKQVYDSLKKSGIILEDPVVPENEIPVVPIPPAKASVFEDEEKSLLLKSLLSSNKPEDLKTANNLIKSLVKTEECKMAKVHERRKDLDEALHLCQAVQSLKNMKIIGNIGVHEFDQESENLLQKHIEDLGRIQIIIYGYANEMAEANDPCLEEVLSINDKINKVLPRKENENSTNRVPTSERAQFLAENQELLVFNSPTTELLPLNGFKTDQNLEGSLLNNMIESEFCEDTKPVTKVQHMTPVSGRANDNKTKNREDSIFETDFLANQRLPTATKALTLNQMTPSTTITLESLDSLAPAHIEPAILSPTTLPENIELTQCAVIIKNRKPLVILDNKGVRILLYWCQPDLTSSNILSYVIAIQNHNSFAIKETALTMKTSDKNVILRLQNLKKDLSGFNIYGHQESINLLFCIQPLNDVKEVEIDFSLEYKLSMTAAISGSFMLTLVPEHTFNLNFS